VSALNEFIELARSRRSIRRFRDEPVGPDTVMGLLEASRWAPSPQNRQGWKFAVITAGETLKRLSECVSARWSDISDAADSGLSEELSGYSHNFTWFHRAPAAIIFFAKRPESFMEHMLGDSAEAVSGSVTAAAMAAQNLLLAAHAAGFGACVITGAVVASEEMLEIAGLGRNWTPVCLVALGFPDEKPSAPNRIPLEEVTKII